MSACTVAGRQALDPSANGCRIPSTADEVLADSQSADRACAADRRKGFDLESFIT